MDDGIDGQMTAVHAELFDLEAFRELVLYLTRRERDVFDRLIEGESAEEAAVAIGMSRKTVDFHRYQILAKLKVKSTPRLIRLASKAGF